MRFIGEFEHLPRKDEEHLSVRSQLKLAAAALKERSAKVLFELLYLKTDGRLSSPDARRGAGKSAVLGYCDERP
jgi:hypothetical protein